MRVKFRLPQIDFDALRRVTAHFGGHLRPFKGKLILSFLALVGVSIMTLLRPWPLKIVFDYALLPGNNPAKMGLLRPLAELDPLTVVVMAAGAVLGLAILSGFLGYAQEILSKTVGHAVTGAIRLQLFAHMQRLPQSYHDYRETGELITRLTGDINLVQDLLVETFANLSGQLLLIVGMLVITFFIDWQLALLVVAVMPLFLLASLRFSTRIKSAANEQREKYGKLVASMEESLAGISQVKAYRQEKQREKLVGKSVSRDYKAGLKTAKLAANYSRLVELIAAVGIGLVLLLGARKAIIGSISPGDLIIFITYVRGIYRPVQSLSKLSAHTAKAIVRGEKVMEILEIVPEVKDRPGALSASEMVGEVRFETVGFAYRGKHRVLHGLSCTIPARKTTVLIGPTGAGKSTVAKLILRLYEPDEGVIYLDGRNIGDYKVDSLRKRITHLTQETFLFRTTIRENIMFGHPHARPEEVEAAAILVNADEFIRRLPEGYETMVGEGGFTLSGGQRQRISFARAALRNSPFMIFDEPATGLDIYAEKEAKQALRVLKLDRTLLIITHRLNFLELADWAVFIRDGQLVEEGKLAELVHNKGEFYDYVEEEIERTGHGEWPNLTGKGIGITEGGPDEVVA